MQRQGKITIKKLELYLELLAFKKNYLTSVPSKPLWSLPNFFFLDL